MLRTTNVYKSKILPELHKYYQNDTKIARNACNCYMAYTEQCTMSDLHRTIYDDKKLSCHILHAHHVTSYQLNSVKKYE